jgi:carbamoyl-phosphate synthase large subunit
MGGQTALNLTVEAASMGIFDRYGVKLIGANLDAIHKAENRELFKRSMERVGLRVPRGIAVSSMDDGLKSLDYVRLPVILRPAFTHGRRGCL